MCLGKMLPDVHSAGRFGRGGGGAKLGKIFYPRDAAKSSNNASIRENILSACCRTWEQAGFSPEMKGARA